jgi:hypothetical protein
VKSKYFLTILTGQNSLSSVSLPEKGSKAGMKNGAGFIPGIEVLAKNPGTVLRNIPSFEKMRSRGSLENA